MIDNAGCEDLVWVTDDLEAVGSLLFVKATLHHVGDHRAYTHDDGTASGIRQASRGSDGRIPSKTVPGAKEVRQGVKQNAFARYGQPAFRD
jgi:hypothetical protein